MMTKQEKLRYGQALRQQMKEKEQRKRNEDLAKRAVNVLHNQSDRIHSQNIDNKEALIHKLETQDYNPFGKAGGGAPNNKIHTQPNSEIENNRSYHQNYTTQEYPPPYNYPQEHPQEQYNYDPRRIPIQNQPYIQPSQPPQPQQPSQLSGTPSMGEYQLSSNNYPLQPTINTYARQAQLPINTRQYQQYPQERNYQDLRNYALQRQPIVPQRQPQKLNYIQPPGRSGLYRQDYSQPQLNNEQALNAQFESRQRIKTLQGQDRQQIYKKGVRNLLRLENETLDEHMVKQKQKLQMQAFLKQQMEEVERRKQEEKERLKRQELEEEQRNREYLERQNQRMRDEERKKVEDKQRLAEENLKNLALKKELEEEAKLKAERDAMERKMKQVQRQREEHEEQMRVPERPEREYNHEERRKKPREDSSSSISDTSSEQNYSKGFNTNVSKQFLKKQRSAQRSKNDKKLEMFTHQIQRMRDEILNQGDMFQKEIQKIKREAERAQDQKRKADLEVEKLRLELEKKNKESQLRLLDALKRNNPYMEPPRREREENYSRRNYEYSRREEEEMDSEPYAVPTRLPPKKPMSKAKQRVYQQPQQPQHMPRQRKQNWDNDLHLQQSNAGTLDAESKKIPLQLQGGGKLTMSGVENFGKEAFLFGQSEAKPRRFEEKPVSRGKEKDQLDKLVENRWQLSTVKDDITQEIEELLKKKDNGSSNQLQGSKISRAGREILSRGGIPYEGPGLGTLNSNKVSLVSDGGTFDIDKLHGRNQARLRELKALGVQTVNTNNDDDLNRLNALLSNYN